MHQLRRVLDALGVQASLRLIAVSELAVDVAAQARGRDGKKDNDKELREQGGQVVPSRVPIRLPSAVRAPPQAKVALLGGGGLWLSERQKHMTC